MPSGSPSTLWRLSEFEQHYRSRITEAGSVGSSMLISSQLLGEIGNLERRQRDSNVVEVIAACRRSQEAALVFLRLDELVWPITLFPSEGIYHSRHGLLQAFGQTPLNLSVMAVEAATITAPALHVREIGGPAAYRALRSLASDRLQAPGALGPAAERLHREAAALRHIAQRPGMSVERGVRLLNALCLTSNLMVSRSHPLARAEPSLTGRSRPAGSA